MQKLYSNSLATVVLCAAVILTAAVSVRADKYLYAVTNTPGLCHLWLLDEPGTPLTSTDIINGRVATHCKGFPPSSAAGGPTSTAGPRPSDGFDGMPQNNTALQYTIAAKTRSFVANPDLLGTQLFSDGSMYGITMEFWTRRAATNNEGIVAGFMNTVGSRYLFTQWMQTVQGIGVREFCSYCKDYLGRQTAYFLRVTPDLEWHHIVMTYDGRNLRSYVDGERVPDEFTSTGQAWEALATPDELVFGGDASNQDMRYLNGDLCRLALYERPLTAAQVERHFKAAKGEKVKLAHYEETMLSLNPCHYWRMDEVYGRPLDAVGNWSLTVWNVDNFDWLAAGPQSPIYAGFEEENYAMGFSRAENSGAGLFNTNAAVVDAFTPTNSFSAGTVDKISMSAWFRLDEDSPPNARQVIAGLQNITGGRYTFVFFRQFNGKLCFFVTDKDGKQLSAEPYADITDSNWHHIVMTWDGETMRTYLDGGDERSITNAGVNGALRPSHGFYIGTDPGDATRSFDGKIDEVALFNHVLSANQVSDLYQAAVRGVIPQGTLIRIAAAEKSHNRVLRYLSGESAQIEVPQMLIR